jgi:multidrug efflux pump subunit AcrA (membrane-fusion protein)
MLRKIKLFINSIYDSVVAIVKKSPLWAFIALLLLLLVLIATSSYIQSQNQQEVLVSVENKKPSKVFVIGDKPKLQMQAIIEKSNVVTVSSFVSGVLNAVYVKEGDFVNAGDPLFYLSSNYSGQNAFAVQTQIAATQLNNLQDTYETQKEVIELQRESAKNTNDNNTNLNLISQQSISETENLIDLNKDILSTLDSQIEDLENTNNNGSNDAAILAAKQLKSQFKASTNSLQQGLRNTKYSSNLSNTPSNLSEDQKEIALRQLEIQEKALELNIEVAKLNFQLARINQSLYSPVSPVSGVVQRVFKTKNDTLSNFDPVLIIAGESEQSKAVVKLSKSVYKNSELAGEATFDIEGERFNISPSFISSEATDGNFYTMNFILPVEISPKVFDGEFVSVEIPVGLNDTLSNFTYVPLDVVHQTQNEDFIYILVDGKAESKPVQLGSVFGEFVEILQGIDVGDIILVRRDIVSGEAIEVVN